MTFTFPSCGRTASRQAFTSGMRRLAAAIAALRTRRPAALEVAQSHRSGKSRRLRRAVIYSAALSDWQIAGLFVVGHWAYQAVAWHRRRHERTVPSILPLVFASFGVGAAIGDWWAVALCFAGLPMGAAINWNRDRLRVHEAANGAAVDALIIASGCLVHRALW